MIKDIDGIISALGGIRPMARKMGHESPALVQNWKRRGRIPTKHWPGVIKELAKLGITMTDTELRVIYTK